MESIAPTLTSPSQHEDSPGQAAKHGESAAGTRKSAAEIAAGRRSVGLEAAKAAQRESKLLEQKDRVKALRAAAAQKPSKQLSPLVMAKLKKMEDRAKKRTVRICCDVCSLKCSFI